MNISDFRNEIPQIILERGEDYFDNDLVLDLTRMDDGKWIAEVEGSSDYTVDIAIDSNGQVNSYYCNCPYDGAICKHVAAAMYAIEDRLGCGSEDETSGNHQQASWQTMIEEAGEKELREFVLDYAAENKAFRHDVQIRFSKPENRQINTAYYQNLINLVFDKYSNRGYIDYRTGWSVMSEIDDIVEKCSQFISSENYNEAFSIASAVAVECVKAIQEMDDSDGQCGGAICEAFELVGTILEKPIDNDLKNTIHNWLYQQMQNPDYSDYSVDDNLEPLFFQESIKMGKLDRAYDFIEQQIKNINEKKSDWLKNHYLTKWVKQKMELLKHEGKMAEVEKIIDDNINLDELRQMRVAQLLEDEAIDKAIVLIKEGIKIAESEKLGGVVHEWKKKLLEIYQKENNTEMIKEISKNLFIENPSKLSYFKIYKGVIPSNTWPKACQELVSYLKPDVKSFNSERFSSNLAQVYIEEKMWQELYEMVHQSKNIQTVIQYTKHLKQLYADELIELYKEGIEKHARHTGRNIYQQLVSYLKNMAQLQGGLPEAKKLKNQLLETYKMRRAMIDEFRKLNWD
ncbi:MAG: SWIM zinc finger family protein [Salinivirgaceae bacterium]|jgi:hypothetical protein|nr:SWIM zinc finger family protein [Salinivirgaceae bacterium]